MSNKTISNKEGLLLVALGDRSLADFVADVEADPDKFSDVLKATVNDIPHYRTGNACSQVEKEAFIEYLDMLKEFVEEEDED